MKLVIHDLGSRGIDDLVVLDKEDKVICEDKKIHHCIGCFGCWIKTPGKCVLKDGYENIGELFSKTDELIVISHCKYGTYSPYVKNVLDRSISYLLPYFKKKNNETHHIPRYKHKFSYSVYFYGKALTTKEKEVATRIVEAHSINLNAKKFDVSFAETVNDLRGKIV